jgi:WD40 repeat protein
VWDVATGEAVHRLTGHSDAVLGLAFSSNDDTLYTGGLDRHVLVWDLAGRRQFFARIVDSAPRQANLGIAVPSPDGRAVVYTGSPATGDNLRFLDVATRKLAGSVADPSGDPIAAWLPPDDRRVVTGAGRAVRVWDRRDNRLIGDATVAPSDISALAATPNGAFVVVGDRSGGVARVESGSLMAVGSRVLLDHSVRAVAAGPGDTAIALLDDKSYAVMDLVDGTVRQRGSLGIQPHVAALSPDGSRLAIGGSSGEVGLLDLDSQEWIAAPGAAHAQYVDGVAFAADGATVVTSSFDGGVRVWDGHSGALLGRAQVGQQHSPAVATLPPGGTEAIVATRDGAVYRLDTRFEKWIEFGCAVAGRRLTTGEWRAVFGDRPYHETCTAG